MFNERRSCSVGSPLPWGITEYRTWAAVRRQKRSRVGGYPERYRVSQTGNSAEFDCQVRQAKIIVVNANIGSTSLIQRKLKIGFARAGAVMHALEQIGVVGPAQGSMPREVLMTPEDLKGGQS
jgi:DNA segregation ATPase FtsK/SpoIIIE-like protein